VSLAKLSDQEESELLARVAARDGEALRELYALYSRRLGSFLIRFTQRRDFIEEVINDTLWVVWRKASEFRGDSRVSTWITGIAYRRALKSARSPGHRMVDSVPIEDEQLLAADEQHAAENYQWVSAAVQELPSEQQLTIQLAYVQGHSCSEIAKIMGCPENTVKSRMFQARAKLRTILERLGGGEAIQTKSDTTAESAACAKVACCHPRS
jgi:RNA polymerase sigma-70 factor (ECF subfamily)